ncbi:MAG: hypothetical protein N2423_09575 [Novosphingobium sp.]|nr:hypothetical protein [Novosphingobium sp.]
MSMQFRQIAQQAAADGAITGEEILALRRAGWGDGAIRPDEAEAIFAINDNLRETTPEWSDFFIEAIGEFIVNGVEPKGYVNDEQADWLMARIRHDGRTDSLTELELLVRIFERALSVPQRLRDYALEQIERAVLTGIGPTRDGGFLEAGNVTEAEARLMRRIIFSTASETPAAVSRREAELLYRIKDQTASADNSPEWQRLFVQGVGNYLTGLARDAALSRERTAELESFMNDHRASVGRFFGRMARSAVSENFLGNIASVFSRKADHPDMSDKADNAAKLIPSEQMWLESRLEGNGRIDQYDQALLDFLASEGGFSR